MQKTQVIPMKTQKNIASTSTTESAVIVTFLLPSTYFLSTLCIWKSFFLKSSETEPEYE